MAGRNVSMVIGAGGMGLEVARRLSGDSLVVVADHDADTARRGAQACGSHAVDRVVDVGSREAVRSLAAAAADLGPVVRVFHSAGLSPTQARPRDILSVDLVGTGHVIDEFERVIAPGGAGVMVASMAGHILGSALLDDASQALLATAATDELLGLPVLQGLLDAGDRDETEIRRLAYGLAKRANQIQVQAAAARWGRRGARINSISPGLIDTPMGAAELADPVNGAAVRDLALSAPAGRIGSPADIADVALFLLGPGASFITGTDVLVDGGSVAAMLHPLLNPCD